MKHTLGLVLSVGAALAPLSVGCGGDDGPAPLFEPEPECEGDAVDAFNGDHQNVISELAIGAPEDGFDLDGDGLADNKLGAVSGLAAEPIEDALANYEIILPIEFFDLDGAGEDACVKFGIYLGVFKKDGDMDGEDTAVEGGDCDDTSMARSPGAAEVADNLLDDNCDGRADEVDATTPSANEVDNDGDGVSPNGGDCDDTTETGEWSSPDIAETCGDGLDNDCSGVADRGADGACNPYDETPETIDIDPVSFENGAPAIAFTSGEISSSNVLTAGPALFAVSVPVYDDVELELRITGAQIEATIEDAGDSVRLLNGRLGGVIDSVTADQVRGLEVEDLGLEPENSLLDAIYANVLGAFLGLKLTPSTHAHPDCHMPDIDVDRDGLEVFCDTTPGDDTKTVDLCIDGDGTEYFDEGGTHCSEAQDADGNYLFVDGISVELNFATQPAILNE